MNNQLIDAYIEEVIKRLPQNKREDIKEELKTLIEDQLEQEDASVKTVLESLGDPKRLADNYQDRTNYLIGPDFYYAYLATLKIVIPIVLLAVTIGMAFNVIFNTGVSFKVLFEYFGSLFMGALQAFTWVTIGFMIASKTANKNYEKEKWSIKDLDVKKAKSKRLSKAEGFMAIFFILIMLVILNVYPEVIGVHSLTRQKDSVLFINIDDFGQYLIWFNIAFILSIAHNFLKIIFDHYKPIYAYMSIPLNFISTTIILATLLQPGLLNPNFNQELIAYGFSTEYNWLNILETIILIIVIISIIGLIVEVIKDLYYSFKYNKDFVIKLKKKE